MCDLSSKVGRRATYEESIGGTMVLPAICFHKAYLSLIEESRSLDRLSLFGAAKWWASCA